MEVDGPRRTREKKPAILRWPASQLRVGPRRIENEGKP
jgi:hypothetical protein